MSAKLFHANIRILRKKANLLQSQLSEKIGVEEKRYAAWEQERSQPDIDNIEKIATVHGVTLDTLFNFDFAKFTS
jgi:transcriptional regulator with XRE-family HTH domain